MVNLVGFRSTSVRKEGEGKEGVLDTRWRLVAVSV